MSSELLSSIRKATMSEYKKDHYRLYPRTFGGDQIRLLFSYKDEKDAFERVLEALRVRIAQNGNVRETEITDFVFGSTLEHDVALDFNKGLKVVLGLHTLNFWEKNKAYIKPLPIEE